jgi:hypothetical protein
MRAPSSTMMKSAMHWADVMDRVARALTTHLMEETE